MPRPIFVVGFQRSGTTLLQELLGGHPEIAAVPEVHYLFRIHDLRDHYGDLTDGANLRRAVHDLLHPPLPLLDDCGVSDERLLERVSARGPGYDTLLDELLLEIADRRGARRWSEKSAGQPLAQLVELFPAAQVVHISRDVVDVVASSVATPWNDHSAVELAGQWGRFESATRAAGASLPDDRYQPVCYEQLVNDPRATLSAVCRFLDVQPCLDEMLAATARMAAVPTFALGWLSRVGQPIDTASVGRGSAVLTEEERQAVRAEAAAAAARPPSVAPTGAVLTPAERWQETQDFFRRLGERAAGSHATG